MPSLHCCGQMSRAVDGPITFDGRSYEYALRARAREASAPALRFCPWCGSLLFRVRVKREVAAKPVKRTKR